MPDKLDRLLGIGSTPDWISPLVAMVQDVQNGPRHDFHVDLYAGWSVNDIKRLLRSHGIKVWGDMIADEMIVFSVPQPQALWTQRVLTQYGIPIVFGMIETRNAATKKKATGAGRLDAFWDWVFDEGAFGRGKREGGRR